MKQLFRTLTSMFLVALLAVGCGNTTQTSETVNPEAIPAVTSAEETTASAVPTSAASEVAKVILLTPAQAKDKLDADDSVVLLDVREPDEYAAEHIPGSILLPLGNISKDAASLLPDKDASIIVYCRSGRRSAMGAEELIGLGYTNVYDLGGILNWPYEKESGMTSSN